MKKILLPLFTLVTLIAIVGCSKTPNSIDEPTLIRLGSDVATKAPVVNGTRFTAGIAGWEHDAAVDYAVVPTWSTTIETTANNLTAQAVSWTTPQYYDADNAITTYMKSWYPAGTLTDSAVAFTNTDGTVDALYASVVSGSKVNVAVKTLAFAHKTTQLKFMVVAGDGLDANTEIVSITVNGVKLPEGFNLVTDELVWSATAKDVTIPEVAANQKITKIATAVGKPIMFQSWADNSLTINVVTSNATYTAKTFTTSDSKLSEGSAYAVTLTFKQEGIALNATVAEWTEATGSGDIM